MNRLFYLPICIGIILTSVSCNRSLVLTSDGASDYTIVIPTVPTEIERKAATEFQRLLALSSSVEVPIAGDTLPKSNREIVIGLTNRTPGNMQDSLQEDGFVIRTEGRSLLINGRQRKRYTLRRVHLLRQVSRLPLLLPEGIQISDPRSCRDSLRDR